MQTERKYTVTKDNFYFDKGDIVTIVQGVTDIHGDGHKSYVQCEDSGVYGWVRSVNLVPWVEQDPGEVSTPYIDPETGFVVGQKYTLLKDDAILTSGTVVKYLGYANKTYPCHIEGMSTFTNEMVDFNVIPEVLGPYVEPTVTYLKSDIDEIKYQLDVMEKTSDNIEAIIKKQAETIDNLIQKYEDTHYDIRNMNCIGMGCGATDNEMEVGHTLEHTLAVIINDLKTLQ